MKGPLAVLFPALVLVALGQSAWHHHQLPERVAAHFNASGQPDGWMPAGLHTAWHIGTVLFLAAVFQGLVLLPARLPREFINIPHRDYWLAPERAAATHTRLAGAIRLMGCATLLFFIALFHLLYQANLSASPRLDSTVWWLTAGLLLALGGGITALTLGFRRPSPA